MTLPGLEMCQPQEKQLDIRQIKLSHKDSDHYNEISYV